MRLANMRRTRGRSAARRPLGALAAAFAVAVSLGACSAVSFEPAAPDKGSVLTVVSLGPVATWDPQRMSSQKDMAFAGRVFSRTLTAYPAGPDAAAQRQLVGDLATNTGAASKDLRTWSFTLREGVTWQDGSPVTCEDVRYGIARSFAKPAASEGLNYPLATLDIPKGPDGASTYAGPYSNAGKAGFDKAVSCRGRTVTFHLTEPRGDFNQMVSLQSFAPYKKSADKRESSTYTVFSNGPYLLSGSWASSTGGSFVRNPRWTQSSDPIRTAQPEGIRYQEAVESQTAAQHIMADDRANRWAVALDSAPPAMQHSIVGAESLRSRSINPRTALVDYLAVNVRSRVLSIEDARRALAVATNRDGYVNALGGDTAATASYSLIGPNIPGHLGKDPLGAGSRGNPAAARALLQASGLTLPVPLRVAYRSSPTADKAMAALKNGWDAGGFEIELSPITKDYFASVSSPGAAKRNDVVWSTWAADWPSGATVLPPLFDSGINLSAAGTGRDYGQFSDAGFNEQMAAAGRLTDPVRRDAAWAQLDASLASRGVYVALAQRRALYIAGSGVSGLASNDALGGHVDLARVGVR